MAPTSTAVFRAVADFASLNREVRSTRKEIEQLQRQAGTTAGFEKFNSQLDKTAAAQKKLRDETKALNTEQSKLGRASGLSGLTKQLSALADAQEKARRSTTAMTAAQTRQQGVLGDSARNMRTLASAAKELATAEEKSTRAAQNHAKSLSDERASADKKIGSVDKLSKALQKLTEEEHAAVATSVRHADAMVREEDSASRASQSHRELASSTRDAGKAANVAAGDHDLFRESIDRIAPAANNARGALTGHGSAVNASGTAARSSAASHSTLGTAIGASGQQASSASGAHRTLASAVGQGSSATQQSANAANAAAPAHRNLASAVGASGSASQQSAGSHRTLASAVQGSTSAMHGHASAANSAASAQRSFGSSTTQTGSQSRGSASAVHALSQALQGSSRSGNQASVSVRALFTSLSPLQSGMRSAGAIGAGLASILTVLVPATAITGIGGLIGALSSLVGALAAVAGAVGPAVGALAAIGPAAIAGATAIGTVMLAFRGVGDALKATTKLQKQGTTASGDDAASRASHARAIAAAQRGVRDAIQAQQQAEEAGARSVADAQRAVDRARQEAARAAVDGARQIRDAQRSVEDAQRDAADAAVAAARRVEDAQQDYVRASERVLRAEEDLHDARRQAIRDLQDLEEKVSDNALSQEGAEIRILRAQERLAEVNADATASALDRREAALALAEAQDNLSDVQRQNTRDTEALNEAQASGIEGMDNVVSATQSLADAQRSQQDAARNVADAQTAAAKSQEESSRRIALAQENLAETVEAVNQRQADSQMRIQDAERNLAEARADAARAQRDAAERVADAQQRLIDAQNETTGSSKKASAAARDLAYAMDKLSPAGKRLVALLLSLQPKLDMLTKTAQEAMFPGLIRGIEILIPMIDRVANPVVKAFGETLGQLAEISARTIFGWGDDILAFGTGDGPAILSNFGLALIFIADAMEDVGVAAVPLLKWLSELTLQLAQYWQAEAQAGRDNQGLARYFERVRDVLALLGRIFYNLGGIIKEVLIAGAPAGRRLLDTFEQLTARTREWMGTAEGKNRMREYFEGVERNARLTLEILGKIALAFLKVGESESVTKILEAINTRLLPSLDKFFEKLDKSMGEFGPEIIDMLADIVDIFTLLMGGEGGGFSTFIEVIHSFVEAIKWMVENIPGFKELIGLLTALAGALLAIKAVGKIGKGLGSGIVGLAGGLKNSAVNQTLAGGQSRAARAGNKGQMPSGSAGGFFSGFRQGASGQRGLPGTGTARLGQAVGGSRVGRGISGAVSGLVGGVARRTPVVRNRVGGPSGRHASTGPVTPPPPPTAPQTGRRRAGRAGSTPATTYTNPPAPPRVGGRNVARTGTTTTSTPAAPPTAPPRGTSGPTSALRSGATPAPGTQLRTGASPQVLAGGARPGASTIQGGNRVLSLGPTAAAAPAPAKIPFGFQPAAKPGAAPRPSTTAPVPVKIVPSSAPIPVAPAAGPAPRPAASPGGPAAPRAFSPGVLPTTAPRATPPTTVGGGMRITPVAAPATGVAPAAGPTRRMMGAGPGATAATAATPGAIRQQTPAASGGGVRGAIGAVGRGAGAVGGALASTAGAIGGSMLGQSLGQKIGGDTGGMVGSIAGSVVGGMAPDALMATFSKLGPLVDGVKTKLSGVATTLSGAVAGAARGAASAFGGIASSVGGAVANVARVAAEYIKVGVQATIAGAKQAASWVVAKGSAVAGLVVDLAKAAAGYIAMGVQAGIAAARTLAANAAALVVRGGLMAWTAAQWLLNAALSANPIALVVIAIAALVAALIYAWNNSETFRAIVIGAWEAIRAAASAVFGWIATFISTVWAGLKAVFQTSTENLKAVWSAFWNVIKTTVEVIWTGIKLFFDIAVAAFKVMWQAFLMILQGNWEGAWNLIKNFASAVWTAIKQYFEGAWNAFKAAWQGLIDAVTKLWNDFWNGMKAVGTTAMDFIKNGLNAAITFIKDAFKTGVDWIGQQWNRLLELVSKPVNFIIREVYNGGIKAMWDKVAGWLKLPPLPIANEVRWGQAEGGAVPITGDKRQGGHNLKSGGRIKGSVQSRDSVPILAQPGEYMLSRTAVNQIGIDNIEALHQAAKRGSGLNLQGAPGQLTRAEKILGGDPGALGSGARGGFFYGGTIRQMLAGGGAAAALDFARAQVGKPYVWGGVGPGGYDCSGFMSAIANVALGQNPYHRRFATGSFGGPGGSAGGFVPGMNSAFVIGVNPKVGNGPGHTAGTLNGVNVESRGGTGPIVGPGARGADSSLFPWKFMLPQVGGSFVSGGAGDGAPAMVTNPLIAIINGIVDALVSRLQGLIDGSIDALLPGGGLFADAMKGFPKKLIDEVVKWVKEKAAALPMVAAGTPPPPDAPLPSGSPMLRSPVRPQGWATGGPVPGYGNRDNVPARLTPGEFVMRKSAAAAIGLPTLHAMNMYPQMFSAGGVVSDDYSKYKIAKGDTLSEIAQRFFVSLKSMVDLNKIKDANKIKADSWLQLPRWASDSKLPEIERNQKKAKRYVSSLKMVTGGWLDADGDFVNAVGLKPNFSVMEDGSVVIFENGKNVIPTKGKGYAYKNNKENGGASATYDPNGGPTPAEGGGTDPASPGSPGAPDGTGTSSANLTAMLNAIQTSTAEQKEFEANLLTLARWGYDDLALNIQKMGLKAGSGEEGGGGLAVSREAIKSPAQAAAIEKALEDAKQVVGEDLPTVLSVIGALKTTAGLGIREVSTKTELTTDAIFKAMSKTQAQAELARLPAANRDKFLANLTAYKNGVAFAVGGRVGGSGNRDTVPAMLTPGEFVLRKSAARALGLPTLHKLNNADKMQQFAHGGEVLRAEDLFSILTPTQISRLGLGAGSKQALSNAMSSNTTSNSSKNVVFEEGSVQVHNAVPQRSTDSFGSVMQKLSWSGAFS